MSSRAQAIESERAGVRPSAVWGRTGLVLLLAMVAGYVDGFGLLAFSTYLSFMSGNTTQTGANLGLGNLPMAIPSAVAIGAFLLGVFAGNLREEAGRQVQHRGALLVVGAALCIACVGLWMRWLASLPSIAFIACAMGVMNTTLSRVGNEAVNLTFVTGALNKIGVHLAAATRRAPLEDAQGAWDTHASRAALLTGVWASFLLGAVLAGVATATLGAWTLLPAGCVLVACGLLMSS